MRWTWLGLVAALTVGTLWCGCSIEDGQAVIFPIWERNDFDAPPAELGPFAFNERRVEIQDGVDGEPFGITIFEPVGAGDDPLPSYFWVLGSNVQAFYHQSLHENLASWAYVVIIPDTRLLTFTDFEYHKRNTDLALQTLDLAFEGELDVNLDPDRVAIGGYSVGGTMAAMAAAQDDRPDTMLFWAPSESPFWLGLDPANVVGSVEIPSYYILVEFDEISPAEGWPATLKSLMPNSPAEDVIIEGGVHHYLQQPVGGDTASEIQLAELTRFELQGVAIELTRERLDAEFGIERAE